LIIIYPILIQTSQLNTRKQKLTLLYSIPQHIHIHRTSNVYFQLNDPRSFTHLICDICGPSLNASKSVTFIAVTCPSISAAHTRRPSMAKGSRPRINAFKLSAWYCCSAVLAREIQGSRFIVASSFFFLLFLDYGVGCELC
jgi:hypothetical protein